jgi:hypothetical protein
MTWTNAFDAGECAVSVRNAGELPNEVWAGVLAKGEESPTFSVNSRTLQVSVDVAGVITLSCSQANYAANFDLVCTPQYALGGAELRASGITVNGAGGSVGMAYFSDSAAGIALAFDVDGACTPDPVSSTGIADAEYIDIYAQNNA